jgi:CspA family cold shock protein
MLHRGNESVRNALAASQPKDYQMTNGTVKFYNSTKGFGFIAPADGSKDAFVHVSALERAGISDLADGQEVTFDLETGRDGRVSAVNVALA